jgi:hypothetical protein
MWYKAKSVITAIEQCKSLSIPGNVPSCPKPGNNLHCLNDFPDCEGKTQKCPQRLTVNNSNGDPVILYFDYYLVSVYKVTRLSSFKQADILKT